MKFLLEFKKYAPVLFTFLFLAAVFASCFFDTRKQDKAEKESQRYDQSLGILAVIRSNYYQLTKCVIHSPDPDKIKIPASNSEGVRCISSIIPDSKFYFITNFDTKEPIISSTVKNNTGLICRCDNTQIPLVGENTWYKTNPTSPGKADPFFTHKYQKDSNGSITGVDPFIPTTLGDVFLCNPSCEQNYTYDYQKQIHYYQMITIQ